jgi:ubiquinone/menaquinone biosynthesis C-methylase UbiE
MSDTARFVGTIPQHYDQCLGPNIFADYAQDLAGRVVDCTPARVLEIAAGTGIVTRRLRDLLPASTPLTATDLNPPMLDVAAAKFRSDERVEFQPADATSLPFADVSFDAVVCQFGVMFFPDKDKSYREVHRVLTPGGRYLFNIWDTHLHNPFARIAHEVTGSFFPADPPQFMTVPFSYRFDPIKESLTEAGFTDINAAVVRLEKEVSDPRDFARGLVYGNPIIEQIQMRGGVDPEAVVEAILREFRREFGTDRARMPLQAIVFSARKPA